MSAIPTGYQYQGERWTESKIGVVSVVTESYAAFAKVALDSVLLHHPNVKTFACFVDQIPKNWVADSPQHSAFCLSDLQIEDQERFTFQYTPFELACAVKPFAVRHLLNLAFDEVFYIDGDMKVMSPSETLWATGRPWSVLLTPHLHWPLPNDGKSPDESIYLKTGGFNAGFLGIRRDPAGISFVDWWIQKCLTDCYVDILGSKFVDQKWLDLAPGMFEGTVIHDDPGVNGGHWSLFQFSETDAPHDRGAGSIAENILVAGSPIVLFHLSGMTPDVPRLYLKHQNRATLEKLPLLSRVVDEYHQELLSAGLEMDQLKRCRYHQMNCGTPIHPAWREAIRRNDSRFRDLVNPFASDTDPNLVARFKAIENEAIVWRHDWRQNWVKERGLRGKARSAFRKLKRFIRRSS